MISVSYIKRFGYAKYIYSKGIEALANNTQLGNALAILSFHDAAEIVLLIIADQLGYKSPVPFMENWDKAEGKGKSLPLRNQMDRLNRLRTSFKHHGILPTRDDSAECQITAQDFFFSVARDILSLDFNSISVSDLIENQTIRGYLKSAEDNIGLEQYEAAISEAATAFAFIMKEATGDHWHPFILEQSASNLSDIAPQYQTVGGHDHTTDRNFAATGKSLSKAKKLLKDIIEKVNPLLLGVDNFRFTRFQILTPMTFIMLDGKTVHRSIRWNDYQNESNMNLENATFCLNFAADAALKAQESTLGLVKAQG